MPNINKYEECNLVMYSVQDIQKIFNLSRAKAYALINSDGFPKIKLNKKIVIPRHLLIDWINKQVGHEYCY